MPLRPWLPRIGRARPRPRAHEAARSRATPAPEALETRCVPSAYFVFDYSLDTNNFFNTSARRDLLNLAGRIVADRLDDDLAPIAPSGSNTWTAKLTHPGTGRQVTRPNIAIGVDVIRIYAGGRNLPSGTLAKGGSGGWSANGSTSWLDTVETRGQPGAADGTDVAPWGGAITFDTRGVRWHFGRTTQGLASNEYDFLSVAIHELLHVLGINSGNPSWTRRISGGKFTGPQVRAENGGKAVPVSRDRGHFGEGVKDEGLEIAMDPSIGRGTRKLPSEIDYAALRDIGWELSSNDTIGSSHHRLTGPRRSSTTGNEASVIFNGSIGDPRDVDVYRVHLDAGTTLTVRATPASGLDSFVRIYGLDGVLLRSADQGGSGKADQARVKVKRRDYYYVVISNYANRNANPYSFAIGRADGSQGSYRLSIAARI